MQHKKGPFCVKFLFFIFFILTAPGLTAATYYVDAVNGRDNNDGKTQSSAWKSIAKVNSRTFQPGDKILFRRGQSWEDQLEISYSGNSNNSIVFESYGTGSLPIIDGSGIRGECVELMGSKYIIIREFRLQNAVGGGTVRIKGCNNITIENCDIYVTSTSGIFVNGSSECTIKENKITTPSKVFQAQTDGIFAHGNSNNKYDGNNIIISNKALNQHCDGIQLFEENNATICNNYIEQDNNKHGNAQGIYVEKPYGTHFIYNNVLYGMHTASSLLKFKNYDHGSNGKARIYGNTIYGGKGYLVHTDDPNVIFKNNIVQSTGHEALVRFEKTLTSSDNVDNNIYKRSGSGFIILHGGNSHSHYKTFNNWKQLGFDRNGMEKDPLLTNASNRVFIPKDNSPAIDNGISLSSPFNIDIRGNSRPGGSNFDIGAYEISGGNDLTPPEIERVELENSTRLRVIFSEPVQSASANNVHSYSIKNKINVLKAALESNKMAVVLTTTNHSAGSQYTLTVSNVKDLAGNVITSPGNTKQYSASSNNSLEEFVLLADDAQIITGAFLSKREGSISNQIAFCSSEEGKIRFNINAPAAGEYYIWGRFFYYTDFHSGDPNSFFIKIGNSQKQIFGNDQNYNKWHWDGTTNPENGNGERLSFNLNKGNNLITISGREMGSKVKLDVVFITTDKNFIPTDKKIKNLFKGGSEPEEEIAELPKKFELMQNYPNPFNPATLIKYSLPKASMVNIKVYDIVGNEVAVLVNEYKSEGTYETKFDASQLASGVYIYRLQTNEFVETKKMMLIR